MKRLGTGWLLALQFFSVIPVKKELPMEKTNVTSMYLMLPLLGGFLGSITAAAIWGLLEFTELSPLFLAFTVVIFGILLTGGLHMDGVADVGDAYFSYQDRKKRLEIMEDPRIGAFGAMALILIIVGKIIVVAEVIDEISLMAIVLVPVFSRIGLLLFFTTTGSAKEMGLSAFFHQQTDGKWIAMGAFIYLAVIFGLFGYWQSWGAAFGLVALLLVLLYVYRKWCLKNFGGVTGDLLGAYVEGTEFLLWTAFLFFI
ncbi:cobalamin-5'-phosphate synthase [Planomicrobium soli]|uniref:Adenosylcobinamide-GDP ribazoletransferase n=1 Tax=Planomicrobium soli TaxID=1176648 RepID=A0A2P8H2Z7_9BACL|nr:adenosylcobinamide-GDP ribazoletransferase [Planomicrobium soli]PSL40593.1 cobalamin-5'-phosphate synthase [Planomicrobium soli]